MLPAGCVVAAMGQRANAPPLQLACSVRSPCRAMPRWSDETGWSTCHPGPHVPPEWTWTDRCAKRPPRRRIELRRLANGLDASSGPRRARSGGVAWARRGQQRPQPGWRGGLGRRLGATDARRNAEAVVVAFPVDVSAPLVGRDREGQHVRLHERGGTLHVRKHVGQHNTTLHGEGDTPRRRAPGCAVPVVGCPHGSPSRSRSGP